MTKFEQANALVRMWDAYDRSTIHMGCRLQAGHASTVAFVEWLGVLMSHLRIAQAKGVLVTGKGRDAWGLPVDDESWDA